MFCVLFSVFFFVWLFFFSFFHLFFRFFSFLSFLFIMRFPNDVINSQGGDRRCWRLTSEGDAVARIFPWHLPQQPDHLHIRPPRVSHVATLCPLFGFDFSTSCSGIRGQRRASSSAEFRLRLSNWQRVQRDGWETLLSVQAQSR